VSDIFDLKNVLLSLISLGGANDPNTPAESALLSTPYRKLCDAIDDVSRIDGNPASKARSAKFWAIFVLGSNIAPILRQWSLVVFACARTHDKEGNEREREDLFEIATAIDRAAELAERKGI
jgi:hypothetical protein